MQRPAEMLGQTRQPYVEDGTFPVFGFHPYFTFHLLGDGFTDGQSQTRTLDKGIQFLEPLEYLGQILFFNAHTCILHINLHSAVLEGISHFDISLSGKLGGIGD